MNPSSNLRNAQSLGDVCIQLISCATTTQTPVSFCAEALRRIEQHFTGIRSAAVIQSQTGRWVAVATVGAGDLPPDALVADAADRDQICRAESWIVAPMPPPAEPGWLLAIRTDDAARFEPIIAPLATVIGCALTLARQSHRAARRVEQLEATLSIAAKWHATLDPEELLNEIARTSTELFDAERATIFLWDRRRKQLVGKPAIGVDGSERVIPDDVGVAGRVVRSNQPLRADAVENRELISEAPDQLGLVTQSLLCVPIQSRRGKVLGAFELINHRNSRFDHEDEVGLIELASHAASAIENSRTHQELVETRSRLKIESAPKVTLIGDSLAMTELRDRIAKVAVTELAVLVLGENGTGKEVVSRMIHDQSDRADQPFVAVNCAALTETLLESELFGHEKGAFTDANETRAGKFEAAASGTLFLDEIGELSQRAQAKLLRALELKTVTRVGGTDPIPTDARVIAATNRDLPAMVRDKSFREDLFFRLNVVTITVPSLRDHADDIIPLAQYFLQQFARKANRPPLTLLPDAERRLTQHDWPGNVRELRNLAERLAYLNAGERIDVSDLGPFLGDGSTGIEGGLPLTEATRQFQMEYIEAQIAAAGDSMTEAARRLGLHRSNLYRKMRQLGMQTDE
jgi:transcriptional regulator with GAF, ATPase, and Fis domain